MKIIGDVAKAARGQAERTWGFTKRLTVGAMVWGLVFSLVTIGELRVAFDYDDTLVFSTPAFERAFKSGRQPFSPAFWQVVNQGYDVERRKFLSNIMAWGFRMCGFKVTILTARPPHGGDALKKEWRYLADDFVFTAGSENKHRYLKKGNYVLFFGDSDSDIQQGRKAEVFSVRVRRSNESSYKEDYNPGTLRELVLPLTEF